MAVNILIFSAAFLVRLIGLNQSLWLDEAVTAKVVQQFNYLDIIRQFSPGDFHPPLYYLFMRFWTNIFGYSEISLRLPSVLFSLLTGYIIYLIGKKIKDEKTGRWAMVFFLFNPLVVYYSQEARMYMMVTLFLTTALFFYTKALNTKHLTQDTVFFNIFIFLSFTTFYGSVFLIAGFLIYFLFKKQYRNFFISCFMFLVTCLIISPLLLQQLANSKEALQNVTNWSLVLGRADLKNLILIPVKFVFGRISFFPKTVYHLLAGVWTILVFYFVIKGGLREKKILFLFVIPIFLGLFFSFASPLLQYFRFLYLLPLMCLLLSFATDKDWQRLIVISGFIALSLVYVLMPQFHREDWQSLAKSLPDNKNIYMITASSDALKYYNNNLHIYELTNLASYLPKEKEVIIVPYVVDIYGFDYKKILFNNSFHLDKQTTFRELLLEDWIR